MAFLEGKRIYLNPMSLEDLKGEYFNWINCQEIDKYTTHTVFPNSQTTLLDYYNQKQTRNDLIWVGIFEKESNKHIGISEINQIKWLYRHGVYSIILGDKTSHGKGYAYEASVLMIRHAFQKLNLNRLELGVNEFNSSAIRLYKKLGFVQEGILRETFLRDGEFSNTIIMSLLAREFKM